MGEGGANGLANGQRSTVEPVPDSCDDRQAVVLDASSLTGGRFPKLQIGVFGGGGVGLV